MFIKLLLLSFLVVTGILASDQAVTEQKIENLEKKLADGQVSTEPGLGQGANTLAEQIEFLRSQLPKKNKLDNPEKKIEETSQTLTNPMTSTATLSTTPSVTTTISPKIVTETPHSSTVAEQQPLVSASQPSTQEFEALKARIAALEARIALLEKGDNNKANTFTKVSHGE